MAWMQIETTRAQLEIITKRAKLNIQNSMPRMTVRKRNAQMEVERTGPTMKFDQPDAPRATSGGSHARVGDVEQAVAVSNSNAGYIRNGDTASKQKAPSVMRSIKNANAAAASGRSNAASLANSRRVRWEPGSLKINWVPYEMEITWDGIRSPVITVEPYEIEIRLRNHPGVKIRLTEEYYADLVGRNVDKKV